MARNLFATAEAGKQGRAHRDATLAPDAVMLPEKQVKTMGMSK